MREKSKETREAERLANAASRVSEIVKMREMGKGRSKKAGAVRMQTKQRANGANGRPLCLSQFCSAFPAIDH